MLAGGGILDGRSNYCSVDALRRNCVTPTTRQVFGTDYRMKNMMGRKQRSYRQTWSIVWERDHWHHIHFKAKRWANKRYRQQLKDELEGAQNTEQLLQPDSTQ